MLMVYVDEAVWEWRGRLWCHLLADSLEELHEFANLLDLKRSWFQGDARYPHYDITESKRMRAIELGAKAVDARTAVMRARSQRAIAKTISGRQAELQW